MTAPANAQAAPQSTQRAIGPHPGDQPLGNPASRWIAILTSLLLLTLAGIAGRDLWYNRYRDEDFSQSWLGQTWDFLGTFVTDAAAIAASVVLLLIGLALLFFTFKPRPRTHVRVNSPVSIWTRPVDIARKATGTARNDVGVEHVRSKANRKKVSVEVTDDGSGAGVQERVTRSLNNEFRGLATPPAVSVKVRPGQNAQPAPARVDQPQTADTQPPAELEAPAVQGEPAGTETTATTTTTTTETQEVQR